MVPTPPDPQPPASGPGASPGAPGPSPERRAAGGANTPPVAPPGTPAPVGPGDRRTRVERRLQPDRRQREVPVTIERRSGADRRTGERRAPRNINAYEMTPDVLELINAVNAHKQRTGRAFPTWSEMLLIIRGLGYEKRR